MADTGWINDITGDRLDRGQLRQMQERAHRLYEANRHIFGDEREALSALGAVPQFEMLRTTAVNHPTRLSAA
jgi:hypothetical protein